MTTETRYQPKSYPLPVTPSNSDPISLKVPTGTDPANNRDRQRSGTITTSNNHYVGDKSSPPSLAQSSFDPSNPMYPSGPIQKPRPASTSSSGSGGSGSNGSLINTPLVPINSAESPFGDQARAKVSQQQEDGSGSPQSYTRAGTSGSVEKSDKARGKQRAWDVDFGNGHGEQYTSGDAEGRATAADPTSHPFGGNGGRDDDFADRHGPARSRSDGSSFSTLNGNETGRDRAGTITASDEHRNQPRRGDWVRVNDGEEESPYDRMGDMASYGDRDGDLGSRSGIREPTIRAIPQGSRMDDDVYGNARPTDRPDLETLEEIRAERKRSVKYTGGRPASNGLRDVEGGQGSGRYTGGSLGRMEENYSGAGEEADIEKGVIDGDGGGAQYPPISEEEAEEKAIQENLARLAARDLARRRAARTSRLFTSSASLGPSSPTSSTFSNPRDGPNPPSASLSFSNSMMVGGGSSSSKRNTLLGGLLGRLGSYGPTGQRDSLGSLDEAMGSAGKRDSELPLTAHAAQYSPASLIPADPSSISRPSSANPFETSPLALTRSITPTTPFREQSNRQQSGIESIASGAAPVMRSSGLPLAGDRPHRQGSASAGQGTDFGSSMLSAGRNPFGTSSTHGSHDDDDRRYDDGVTDENGKRSWEDGMAEPGWKGSAWRGGAGDMQGRRGSIGFAPQMVPRQEKWWSALCAWGDDLDDGAENAGRTNPFE